MQFPRSLPCLLIALASSAAAQSTCPVQWAGVGGGLTHSSMTPAVWAQAEFDDGGGARLFVGGLFEAAGGVPASNIAVWDGTTWSALGSGLDGQVEALCVFDDDGPGPNSPALYVGGSFAIAGGVPVSNLARWDGSSWSDVGGGVAGLFGGSVSALEVHDDDGAGPLSPALYVGGLFFSAGSTALSALNVARWDGVAFSDLDIGVDNGVLAFASYSEGGVESLFAAGYFTHVGANSTPTSMVARWDGAVWSKVGLGLIGDGFVPHVSDLLVHDDGSGPALYAGGSIKQALSGPVERIARWNGSSWSGVGAGLSGAEAIALEVWDDGTGDGLYAAGAFSASGATALENVARWDGAAWSPVGVGDGTNTTALSLATFDDGSGIGLHVGGVFAQAGTVPVSSYARAAPAGPPTIYCTAMQNSQGCTPTTSTNGFASMSATAAFRIDTSGVLNQEAGLLVYSTIGQAGIPYGNGILCIQPPLWRLPSQSTGGSSAGVDCSGTMSFDLNAYISSGADPALLAGAWVYAQSWTSDPALGPGVAGALTRAVRFQICP